MGACGSSAMRDSTKEASSAQIVRQRTAGGTVLSGKVARQRTANATLLAGGEAMGKASYREATQSLEERTQKYGLPTAAAYPPGQCQLTEEWQGVPLIERYNNHRDTIILTFALPDTGKPLGLSTCACILAKCDGAESSTIVRPYTPVSTNATRGRFQLLVKIYEEGQMTQFLNNLSIGAKVQFKHSSANVKKQYPFGKQHVTMLAGGTGITPMLQALHAILGTPEDATQVSMIYSNKTTEDIACQGLLDTWAELYPARLKVLHWLSRGDAYSLPQGHITREVLEENTAAPSEDVLVMVCGPPSMYHSLCGPRESTELTGLLMDMGYTSEQVVKF